MSGDAVDRYRQRIDDFTREAALRSRRVAMDYALVPATSDAIDFTLRRLVTMGALR